jgi:hypothetical protein
LYSSPEAVAAAFAAGLATPCDDVKVAGDPAIRVTDGGDLLLHGAPRGRPGVVAVPRVMTVALPLY